MLATRTVCRGVLRGADAPRDGCSSRRAAVCAASARPVAARRCAHAFNLACSAPAALCAAVSRARRPASSRSLAVRARAASAAVAEEPAPELSGGLSEDEAVANIIKAVMGAGVFSLPWAVAQGGVVFVPAFIVSAAVLALYTLSMLVAAKRKILALRPEVADKARNARRASARLAGGVLAQPHLRAHQHLRVELVSLAPRDTCRCPATPASSRRRSARSAAGLPRCDATLVVYGDALLVL